VIAAAIFASFRSSCEGPARAGSLASILNRPDPCVRGEQPGLLYQSEAALYLRAASALALTGSHFIPRVIRDAIYGLARASAIVGSAVCACILRIRILRGIT